MKLKDTPIAEKLPKKRASIQGENYESFTRHDLNDIYNEAIEKTRNTEIDLNELIDEDKLTECIENAESSFEEKCDWKKIVAKALKSSDIWKEKSSAK